MKYKILVTPLFLLSACCCSGKSASNQPKVAEIKVPGTVSEPWVETMHDTVKVQGQLDPTNTYYRAPHQTVVEIRPGKYQNVTYSGDKK